MDTFVIESESDMVVSLIEDDSMNEDSSQKAVKATQKGSFKSEQNGIPERMQEATPTIKNN